MIVEPTGAALITAAWPAVSVPGVVSATCVIVIVNPPDAIFAICTGLYGGPSVARPGCGAIGALVATTFPELGEIGSGSLNAIIAGSGGIGAPGGLNVNCPRDFSFSAEVVRWCVCRAIILLNSIR